jgi:hypothetical protein
MSLASSTIQPTSNPVTPTTNPDHSAALLAGLVLSVYAAQRSSRQLRKLKRRAMLTFLKLRLAQSFRSFFSAKKIEGISTRTLLYILLGLLVLILLFTLPPLVAVVVLLIGILFLLLWKS